MIPISTKSFTGRCEVCDDVAELRASQSTALLQAQTTQELSAVRCQLVRCMSGDHAYYILDWKSMVTDPFPEGWEPTDEQLDLELPPPPPKEEPQ